MLTTWLKRRLDQFERTHDYDMSYARELLAVSPAALLRFRRATLLGQFRQGLPEHGWHLVHIVGLLYEDCGACVQLAVKLALASGVPAPAIEAAVAGTLDGLSEEQRLVVEFARVVLVDDPRAQELRALVRERLGRQALVSIAFALTTARMYPSVKRVLGHAGTCTRVQLGAKWLVPAGRHEPVHAAPSAA